MRRGRGSRGYTLGMHAHHLGWLALSLFVGCRKAPRSAASEFTTPGYTVTIPEGWRSASTSDDPTVRALEKTATKVWITDDPNDDELIMIMSLKPGDEGLDDCEKLAAATARDEQVTIHDLRTSTVNGDALCRFAAGSDVTEFQRQHGKHIIMFTCRKSDKHDPAALCEKMITEARPK